MSLGLTEAQLGIILPNIYFQYLMDCKKNEGQS